MSIDLGKLHWRISISFTSPSMVPFTDTIPGLRDSKTEVVKIADAFNWLKESG